jgi:hypothetical protein
MSEQPIEVHVNTVFPEEYIVPTLPQSLMKDIENGLIQKFGPHCSNRQVLIDAVCHDLCSKFNLL